MPVLRARRSFVVATTPCESDMPPFDSSQRGRGRVKLTLTYPASTGRNFDELLRTIDSLQLTAGHQVATPVNWRPGDEVIIVPGVSDTAARERYPAGWRAPTPYLRYVPAPK